MDEDPRSVPLLLARFMVEQPDLASAASDASRLCAVLVPFGTPALLGSRFQGRAEPSASACKVRAVRGHVPDLSQAWSMNSRDAALQSDPITMQVLTPEELQAVLDRNRLWLETYGVDGERAELMGACLRGISLRRANLRLAILDSADRRDANLDHAQLSRHH